ncbi:cytochrome bd-I oxidase subunit CydX [Vibrio gigantis]|uniref:Cytochrome bd-I oxidase subunit CydX n=1 Tax=Vibrio gigantis TaxID=296199 RepID=A0A5M9N546_9VIBR|nr:MULTISPECIES: cytochrome bd-I oxidase subunit CydX [Vibrio]KAA8667076.1 cytochrome bd-I oxidase subunit CydX [Vibrio gigantis]ULN62907.1 cytochrome bd-I oxidase subunit CydX [Vibrio gigantis]
MWYLCWVLGVLLASAFGIINALWLEHTDFLDEQKTDR